MKYINLGRLSLTIRVMHVILLATAPIAAFMLVLLPRFGFVHVFTSDELLLALIEIVIVGFSLLFLVLGFFLPWFAMRNKRVNETDNEMFNAYVIRVAFFEPIVVYGFVLGLLGGAWHVVLPILILSFTTLLLAFPTDKRLSKWQEDKNPPFEAAD